MTFIAWRLAATEASITTLTEWLDKLPRDTREYRATSAELTRLTDLRERQVAALTQPTRT